MLLFADTADYGELERLSDLGLIDGVTTNPSLVAKAGKPIVQTIRAIAALVPGPVSAEVSATDYAGMVAEGEHLAQIAANVVVKLPLTLDGLKATRHFAKNGIATNVTLCFSASQGLLAAKAGATYLSPFVGRLDDVNLDGLKLLSELRTMFDTYRFPTKILAASIRSSNHVSGAALLGADAVTAPMSVLLKLVSHPLTTAGLEGFLRDWKNANQTILPLSETAACD